MTIRFDGHVPPGGYAWWYLDAWSDDGTQGLVLIAFVGSVFSPYYALARRRGLPDPEQHCAVNLALYGAQGAAVPRAWCMTERGARHVRRSRQDFVVGPSALRADATGLQVELDERAVPWPSRLRGTITLRTKGWRDDRYALDASGSHHWSPLAPVSTVDVAFDHPAMHWRGTAYLDSNTGARPLDADFSRWDWSRAPLPDGSCAVAYDVTHCNGSEQRLALELEEGRRARSLPPSPRHAIGRTAWRMPRHATSDAGSVPRLVQTLEDGPFYARSRVHTRAQGHAVVAMHESLSLERWRRPLVQAMLPFRMPRRS